MMKKPFFRIPFFAFLALSACVSIPSDHLTVSHRGGFIAVHDADDCGIDRDKEMVRADAAQEPGLDSGGFRMLTWNMFKGMKEGWKQDFEHLTAQYDILTIQEARLTDDLRELLKRGQYNWDISVAFTYNGAETGVLTASRSVPDFACAFRITEPLISLPKTALVTKYPLSGTDKTLMVVNIHSINFTLGTQSFNAQLQEVEHIVSRHHGPVIFSGDVNTWSKKRMALLRDFAMRLGLKAVPFNTQGRTRVLGRATDHIYYRALTVTGAAVIEVNSSDHNPLLVAFRLEESR